MVRSVLVFPSPALSVSPAVPVVFVFLRLLSHSRPFFSWVCTAASPSLSCPFPAFKYPVYGYIPAARGL